MSEDKKKTIKFQMMMSPAEAEALDDWGFKRRIRSRAESIRRLCQVGMSLQDQIPTMLRHSLEASEAMDKALAKQRSAIEAENSKELLESVVDVETTVLRQNVEHMRDLLEAVVLMVFVSGGLNVDEAIEFQGELRGALAKIDKKSEAYHRLLLDLMKVASGEKKISGLDDLVGKAPTSSEEVADKAPAKTPGPLTEAPRRIDLDADDDGQ